MASRVKLLPENLINRIAAGEVVERPASILKELVENSLDAGASKIEIDIEAGGKRLVRVADNGCGLNKEELFLCLERHATSKLDENSDLMAISTLGFRGEALPSIASISKLSITSNDGSGEGNRIRIEGGKIIDLSPAPSNQGTVIEVRDIFYNVPARRKFLKSQATETAHLLETAQRYALSRSDLRLVIRESSKELLRVDERSDMASRIMTILGREAARSLKKIEYSQDDLRIDGWLASPEAATRTSGSLFVFVLGRPVRDRLLTKAVTDGFGRILPHGRWPAGAVFVAIDPSRVDVNVHPAKTEVRFREPGMIFDALSKAVRKAVDAPDFNLEPPDEPNEFGLSRRSRGAPPKSRTHLPGLDIPEEPAELEESYNDEDSKAPERKTPFRTFFSMGRGGRPQRERFDFDPIPPWMEEQAPEASPHGADRRGSGEPSAGRPNFDPRGFSAPGADARGADARGSGAEEAVQIRGRLEAAADELLCDGSFEAAYSGGLLESERLEGEREKSQAESEPVPGSEIGGLHLRPLAQLHRSYILAQGPKGLHIIDQHAAHERIIFNRLKAELQKKGLPAQGLLMPQTMELDRHEILAVERLKSPLERLGYRLEPFGGSTWIVKAIPGLLSPGMAREALREILSNAKSRIRSLDGAGIEGLVDDLSGAWLYSLACRAAVKAGDKLTMEEMESLVKDMSQAGAGGHCPHGRPTVWTITLSELERRFGRA